MTTKGSEGAPDAAALLDRLAEAARETGTRGDAGEAAVLATLSVLADYADERAARLSADLQGATGWRMRERVAHVSEWRMRAQWLRSIHR